MDPVLLYSIYIFLILKVLFVHELGHYLSFLRHNVRVSQVGLGFGPTLFVIKKFAFKVIPLGAYIEPNKDDWEKSSSAAKVDMALAGITTNILFGIVLALYSFIDPLAQGVFYIAVMHFTLAIVNIIPIPPLDGWVALKEILALAGRPLSDRSIIIAARVANGVIYGLGFFVMTSLALGGDYFS